MKNRKREGDAMKQKNELVIPNEDRRYYQSHVWAQPMGNGRIAIGITSYGREKLKDVAYIDVADTMDITNGAKFTIESTKTIVELVSPALGVVIESAAGREEEVEDDPERVPVFILASGWTYNADESVRTDGMDACQYAYYVAELDD